MHTVNSCKRLGRKFVSFSHRTLSFPESCGKKLYLREDAVILFSEKQGMIYKYNILW